MNSIASGFDPALRGHMAQRKLLLERLQEGRLPGSILLVGPEGIGKRRVAMEMAQRELCFKRTACGFCDGCKLFKENPLPVELPNFLRIAPEGKAGMIRIGVIREDDLVEGGVIRWAHQAPPPRSHRWVVVEDAHRLHGASANMLLKTLEEPPQSTHFILVTHRPDSVLQTIRSRCERITFAPLDVEEAWRIALENGWEPTAKERWTAFSRGTLRYLDPAAYERAEAQVEAWLQIGSGTPFGAGETKVLLPDRASDRAHSEQMSECLELLLAVLADALRMREGHHAHLAPWRAQLERLAGRDLDWIGAQRGVLEFLRNLTRNPNAELVLRDVSLLLVG